MVKIIKIIKKDDSAIRVICGALYEEIDVDWSSSLDELRNMLEILLSSYLNDLQSLREIKSKRISVYQGNNHIDLIGDKGSLNILKISDHLI
ncbi:MAG: hypothetical protein D3916_07465 [Candidatus Electrothrix sp. MAN1_4]|nr:hypothetical protein [Candidatus Electrothrix sp. MAN1_4]